MTKAIWRLRYHSECDTLLSSVHRMPQSSIVSTSYRQRQLNRKSVQVLPVYIASSPKFSPESCGIFPECQKPCQLVRLCACKGFSSSEMLLLRLWILHVFHDVFLDSFWALVKYSPAASWSYDSCRNLGVNPKNCFMLFQIFCIVTWSLLLQSVVIVWMASNVVMVNSHTVCVCWGDYHLNGTNVYTCTHLMSYANFFFNDWWWNCTSPYFEQAPELKVR